MTEERRNHIEWNADAFSMQWQSIWRLKPDKSR